MSLFTLLVDEKDILPSNPPYIMFSSQNAISLSANKYWDGKIEYSTNLIDWHEWNGSSISSTSAIYLRGIGNTVITGSAGRGFTLSGTDITALGNLENLLDYASTQSGGHPPQSDWCFSTLFYNSGLLNSFDFLGPVISAYGLYSTYGNCKSIKKAGKLLPSTLSTGCYMYMYSGDSSLVDAPELPSMNLANGCYSFMFLDCIGMDIPPALPATELATSCYGNMFWRSGITTTPELPALTTAMQSYENMFRECKRLTTASEIKAQTIAANACNGMFVGASSLISPPKINAVTVGSFGMYAMFSKCFSLRKVPKIYATTYDEYGLSHAFEYCQIKVSTTQTTECPNAWRFPASGTMSGPENWAMSALYQTLGPFTASLQANTTYYTDATVV